MVPTREERLRALQRRINAMGNDWPYTTIIGLAVNAMRVECPSGFPPLEKKFCDDVEKAIDAYLGAL
jgi:hypothetical protein